MGGEKVWLDLCESVPNSGTPTHHPLVDISDIFYSFLVGEGEGGVRGAGGGGRFFIENPRRGGFPERGGAGRVSAANWVFLGGRGANFFFRGPKRPPRPR